MALEVDIFDKIRYLYEHEGQSQRAIAKMLRVSRNTVKKYCDGSQVPWERQGVSGQQRYVVIEEVMKFIQECLAADEDEGIKKQEHTAKRIFDRLEEEKGFKGGESIIRRIVATLKEKQRKVYIPLSFDPGEAIQSRKKNQIEPVLHAGV
ncbi:MAG: hypothetical protein AAGT88_03620 [Dethiobacter sp.]